MESADEVSVVKRPNENKTPLPRAILHIDDDFAEFADYCAFLFDVVAVLGSDGDGIDPTTRAGLQR